MKFTVTRDVERITYTTNPQGTDAAATVIIADKSGVSVTSMWGPIKRELDLNDFVLTVRKAWAHHEFLQRNMVSGATLDEATAQRLAADRAAYASSQLAAASRAIPQRVNHVTAKAEG